LIPKNGNQVDGFSPITNHISHITNHSSLGNRQPQAEEVADLLEFESVVPIQTVGSVLKAAGREALLDDPLLLLATADVHPAGGTIF
jgi:hypothetical protein